MNQQTGLAMLASYCLAGCLDEHFITFRAWSLIPNNINLLAVHSTTGTITAWLYVVPKVALTAWMVSLRWSPPAPQLDLNPGLGAPHLDPALAWMTLSWAVSFAVMIPNQLRVRRSADRVALRTLRKWSWVRVVSMVGVWVTIARATFAI